MAQYTRLLTQTDVLAVPTSSRRLGGAIFTKLISQIFTLLIETTPPPRFFLFIKAQNYPQMNNERKQVTLRSMTNRS